MTDYVIVDGVRRVMTAGEIAARPVAAIPVPQVVSMAKALIVLRRANLLTTVEAAVTQAGGETLIAWNRAYELERNSTLVVSMAASLGLTSQQMDDLFTAAAAVVL